MSRWVTVLQDPAGLVGLATKQKGAPVTLDQAAVRERPLIIPLQFLWLVPLPQFQRLAQRTQLLCVQSLPEREHTEHRLVG